MYAPPITPSIEVTIGRETRLYHAFITTAPATVRRASHGHAPHRAAFGRVGHGCEPDLAQTGAQMPPARLVLVDGTELAWQRARYRERGYLCAPTDPVLVGVNTLQHWLWNRIGSPTTDLELANA